MLGGLAAGGAALALRAQAQQPAADGEALAEQLVIAMGGREPWRAARGLSIEATHYEAVFAEPYENVLYIGLEEARMRFEGRNAKMRRIRAVVGERGWRVSEVSPLGPMTPEQVKGDRDWWEAHPYRNVRRLAVRDPAVTPRAGPDGRLELVRPDGRRLMWYRLNPAGEPYAFGVGDSDTGVVLGPLAEVAGGVRLPIWSARMDGTFRATGQKGRVMPTVPPVDYDKP